MAIKIPAVTPASSVTVCLNVPLDNSYTDTIHFKNEAEQLAYFERKALRKFDNLSPVHLEKAVRLPIVADALYGCNYLIIKNANYTSKNLFAFITEIEFVNANTCLVHFELDVMQSWYFNMDIKTCYVEREHVSDDSIGNHTIDEGIPFGDYICSGVGNPPNLGAKVVVCQYADGKWIIQPRNRGGIVSSLTTRVFETSNAGLKDALQTFLSQMGEKGYAENIVTISMSYKWCVRAEDTTTPGTKTYSVTKRYGSIDGYTPKNNKLYCYPYNFLYCDNGEGQSGSYRFEWFSTPECNFTIYGLYNGDTQLVLVPRNYNHLATNIDERMEISNFPQCAWTSDTYKAYVAQNSTSSAISAISSVIGMGASAVSGNPVGVAGGALALGNIANGFYKASIAPDKVHGATGSATMYAAGLKNFNFIRKHIKSDYARSIDDYFTRYGYRVNKLKVPNRTNRKSFNYVKTNGACVKGTVPFNDLAKIKSILDSGITFWHGDYVGDYGRDNSIV